MNYLEFAKKIFFCALVIFGAANLHSVPPGSVFKPRTSLIQPYRSPLIQDKVPPIRPYVPSESYQLARVRPSRERVVQFADEVPALEDESPEESEDLDDDSDYHSDLELAQRIRIKIAEIEREYSAQGFKYLLKNADSLLAEIEKMSKSSQLHLLFLILRASDEIAYQASFASPAALQVQALTEFRKKWDAFFERAKKTYASIKWPIENISGAYKGKSPSGQYNVYYSDLNEAIIDDHNGINVLTNFSKSYVPDCTKIDFFSDLFAALENLSFTDTNWCLAGYNFLDYIIKELTRLAEKSDISDGLVDIYNEHLSNFETKKASLLEVLGGANEIKQYTSAQLDAKMVRITTLLLDIETGMGALKDKVIKHQQITNLFYGINELLLKGGGQKKGQMKAFFKRIHQIYIRLSLGSEDIYGKNLLQLFFDLYMQSLYLIDCCKLKNKSFEDILSYLSPEDMIALEELYAANILFLFEKRTLTAPYRYSSAFVHRLDPAEIIKGSNEPDYVIAFFPIAPLRQSSGYPFNIINNPSAQFVLPDDWKKKTPWINPPFNFDSMAYYVEPTIDKEALADTEESLETKPDFAGLSVEQIEAYLKGYEDDLDTALVSIPKPSDFRHELSETHSIHVSNLRNALKPWLIIQDLRFRNDNSRVIDIVENKWKDILDKLEKTVIKELGHIKLSKNYSIQTEGGAIDKKVLLQRFREGIVHDLKKILEFFYEMEISSKVSSELFKRTNELYLKLSGGSGKKKAPVVFAQQRIADLSAILDRTAKALESPASVAVGIATLTSFFTTMIDPARARQVPVADAMVESGLADGLMALLEKIPKKATYVFSADLPGNVVALWSNFLKVFCDVNKVFALKTLLKKKSAFKRAISFSYADLVSRQAKMEKALASRNIKGSYNLESVNPLPINITKKSDVYWSVERENMFIAQLAVNLANSITVPFKDIFTYYPNNKLQAMISLRIVLGFLNHPHIRRFKKTHPLNALLNANILNSIAVVFMSEITADRDDLFSQMFVATFNKFRSLFSDDTLFWPIASAAATKDIPLTNKGLSIADVVAKFDNLSPDKTRGIYAKYKETATGWTLKTEEELQKEVAATAGK